MNIESAIKELQAELIANPVAEVKAQCLSSVEEEIYQKPCDRIRVLLDKLVVLSMPRRIGYSWAVQVLRSRGWYK